MRSTLVHKNDHWRGTFFAMAGNCEILIDVKQKTLAQAILNCVEQEVKRIEKKYSRYTADNIIYKINNTNGRPVNVDDETGRLLDYANQCYELSDGAFDITSGVLRKVWKFDGSEHIPTQNEINNILNLVGWQKIKWRSPELQLLPGMQIDFGGLGKEYAADRAALLVSEQFSNHVLINLGGDIAAAGPRQDGRPWEIGLQDPNKKNKTAMANVKLHHGAVATSGDLNRFLLKDGVRYTHILNPNTGWPVKNAPRQVTVIADTCTDAGMLSTFSILHGQGAEDFLKAQDVEYRIIY